MNTGDPINPRQRYDFLSVYSQLRRPYKEVHISEHVTDLVD